MTAGGTDRRPVIDGRFELLERLGGGGMGQVWRARDLVLQRDVALKEVTAPAAQAFGADSAQAGVLRQRVLREAQALARLHHPNVVTIFHIVDSHELQHPWLVMELVTGGSLYDRLTRGPLTVPEATRIGRGVLSALRAAHAAGIQHRDVKPGNVLLRADGTPVLTDFGIAALQESPGLTATGMLIGSPEFMAPERIHGQEGDPASDLWSLGLLLYVGLEGFNPLRRETTIATIAAVVDAPIPPPAHSGALAPVLAGLLVRDPAHRSSPEWADQMLSDVERAVATGSDYRTTPATFQMAAPPVRPTPPHGTPAAHAGFGMPPHQVRNPYEQLERATDLTPPRRRRTLAPYMAGLMTVGIAGGTLWIVHSAVTKSALKSNTSASGSTTGGDANGSGGSPTAAKTSGVQDATGGPSGGQTTPPATTGTITDLLTPAGSKAMIAALEAADGNTAIVSMTVYPTYADFEVVKKSDHTLYDNWTFRDGVAAFDSAGGTLDSGQNTIKPSTIKWDALPNLLKVANADLKVPKPKDRYYIIDSDLIEQTPEWLVYLSDDYGGGYVAADLNGKISREYPRGS
jgi:serine/threonine protein kinase